jgi:phosphoribosylaminoimidazole-succinocarboxamide synthase
MMSTAMYQSNIQSLKLLNRGKVRDIYEVDADHLLIVTTDRLSAFDVVLPTPIPGKGEVLTAVSNFWFGKLKHVIPNQLTGIPEIPQRVQHSPARRPARSGQAATAAIHSLHQGGNGRPR